MAAKKKSKAKPKSTVKPKSKAKPKPKSKAKPKPTKKSVDDFKARMAEAAALHELEMMMTAESPMPAGSPAAAEAPVSEPPINRDPALLDADFRARLLRTLDLLRAEGLPFKFHEGFRTVTRQQWLYGQGRPKAKPFGRPGNVVTMRDGVKKLSNHQGNGAPGSGCAADCYPLNAKGKVNLKAPQKVWKRYAEVAESQGLTAGFRWVSPHDPPHIELRK